MNCCQVPTVIKSCFLIYLLKKRYIKKEAYGKFLFQDVQKTSRGVFSMGCTRNKTSAAYLSAFHLILR